MKQSIPLLVMSILGSATLVYLIRSAGNPALMAEAADNAPGEAGVFDVMPDGPLEELGEAGRHTIVLITARWCPGCRQMENYLGQLLEVRPDIAIKRINFDEAGGWDHASQRLGVSIKAVPHVTLIDQAGVVLAQDDGENRLGAEMLAEWLEDELNDW